MNAQNEFSSFKALLKQVYSAYSTKVKELENEIKLLKEKLAERERKTNDSSTDCKRCIELEKAFKTCKNALHEQSKWFENFGQKFSIFSSSEFENNDFKESTKSTNHAFEAAKICKSVKGDKTFSDENVSSVILQENDNDLLNYISLDEKLSNVSGSKQNLLNKVMIEDGETFDAYTVTFNKNLNLNSSKLDSVVLAPDSLSTALDTEKITETVSNQCWMRETEKRKKLSDPVEIKNLKSNKANYKEAKIAHKRLSSETLNEERVKRPNKGNLSENTSEIVNVKIVNPGISEPKTCDLPQISKNIDNKRKDITDLISKTENKYKINSTAVEITIFNDKIESLKDSSSRNIPEKDVKSKIILNQTSPSLIPMQLKAPAKVIDLEPISNDDDFQEFVLNSKPLNSEESWDASDRKKSLRKNRNMKCIKSTSKYKMTLDAPPLNYKKPTYKQTKLSKSIFQRTSDSSKKSLKEETVLLNNSTSINKENESDSSSTDQDHVELSVSGDTIKSPYVVDIDATFIPENFKLESPQYNTTSVKKNTVEKSHLKNGSLFCNISFPDEYKFSAKNDENLLVKDDENKDSSIHDVEFKENMNSFDRLPLPEEPNYKYKNDVVRKKAERRQLNGFDCKECEKYYSELGLSDKEKKERMKKCSRHRGKFSPPATPDHFWELDFPDTEECKARGYLNKTQKIKLNDICDI